MSAPGRKPFHHMTAREIAGGVRSGAFTAKSVAKHFLDRVKKHDPKLHAFLAVDPDVTQVHAARVDQAVAAGRDPGPLAGVPVALKDNLCIRGLPTTCASKILEGWRPPYDADAVTKLLAAGAVPLGKTNLDEFAMGSSTENSAFGPTRNPWDLTRVPGGSSGGSAAAVGAGLAPLGLGSDTGGSIRQPAALCGIVGAMGTYGRVSRRGLVAFGSSLDRIGPLARNAADAALLLSVMSGGDAGDATTLREAPPDWAAAASAGVAGLRIGVLRSEIASDADVTARQDAALDALRAAGAAIVEVTLPHAGHAIAVYYLVAPSEASSNLARFDAVRYGLRVPADDLASMTSGSREQGFGPEVKRRILLGTFALSAGYSDAFYEKALRVRRLIANDFAAAFASCDVVVCPTSPFPAFPLGSKADDPLAMYLCDVFATPASLAGLPALSAPAGATPSGLPVGLQVVAPALREDQMFRVAGALETAFGPAPLPEAYR
ncbi:MAG: Asp-tRNA(Asn)/Glu-tRNA(Gln) amidotransferase subunit GatA [Planctomycetes bacterium]|nr:Asp-tRNA(Asn)/Glu-tRNA(Gln) amidotransferase subunit GatA [Planctomycetota bacterium]